MAVERIGYRHLYDAVGCSLVGREELYLTFPVGDHQQAHIYLGPRPKLGISLTTSTSKYLVLGESTRFNFEFQKDASLSTYPRHFFCEVAAWESVQVPDELSNGFRARDSQATDTMIALAQEDRKALQDTVVLLAGTIGLRFHQQFVLELINEGPFVYRGDDDFEMPVASPGVRQLTSVSLTQAGINLLEQTLTSVALSSEEAREYGANALCWLIRAWNQQDAITKFMMLFIALEYALDGIKGSLSKDFSGYIEALRRLVKSGAGDGQQDLEKFLDRVVADRRPSLNSRFEELARAVGQPGWQEDVAAFRKFNKMRNDLLHQGEPGVKIMIKVTTDEVRHLQDLAERYVCIRVFGDTRVYQDQWLSRPRVDSPSSKAT